MCILACHIHIVSVMARALGRIILAYGAGGFIVCHFYFFMPSFWLVTFSDVKIPSYQIEVIMPDDMHLEKNIHSLMYY